MRAPAFSAAPSIRCTSGHLVAAVCVRHELELDRVLLVVANEPWQKVGEREVTPAEDRFSVVASAVEGIAGVEASRIEIERGGPTYTADTVAQLSTSIGGELYLIVGGDLVRRARVVGPGAGGSRRHHPRDRGEGRGARGVQTLPDGAFDEWRCRPSICRRASCGPGSQTAARSIS